MAQNKLNLRQTKLRALRILDTPPEPQFDDLARLASEICEVPSSFISLSDEHRQWFKATSGSTLTEVPAESAICPTAILEPDILVVEDTQRDPRFSQLAVAQGENAIRFYAGVPLRDSEGTSVGVLCVCDQVPRTLTEFQVKALMSLAKQVMVAMEVRGKAAQMEIDDISGESVLRAKHELESFKSVFDNLLVGIIRVNAEDGRIIMANKAYIKMLGYEESELLATTVHDITLEEERDKSIVNLNTHFKARTGFTFEKRYVTKTGEIIWVRVKANPMAENRSDFSCVVLDIGEERRAWAAQRESFRLVEERERQLEIATSAAFVGVWDWNLTTNFLHYSKIMREMLGINPEVQNPDIGDFERSLHPDDLENIQQVLKLVIEGKLEYNHEYRIIKDGEIRWLAARGQLIRDEAGVAIKFVGAASDITDIRRDALDKEQMHMREVAALSASQLKTEFLANMSHEIRTPLNGVIGLTELLLDTELGPEQLHFASAIRHSSNVLLEQINDILDLTKIEAGKLELDQSVFDLGDLVKGVQQVYAPLAQDRGIELAFRTDLGSVTRFMGDAGRVRQILNNLLGNALKFTKNGRIDLAMDLKNEPNGARIEFHVKDTGVGISGSSINKLFKSFSQADASMARQYGGSGLGLAICKRLIQLMGGEIRVESRFGEGSEFIFFIYLKPLVGDLLKTSGRTVGLESQETLDLRAKHRILVAEDNGINQEVALRFLKKAGFKLVDVVGNGEEAIRAVAIVKYDLILMDCQMPVKDGYQATAELRSSGETLPIIALTANAFTADRERCVSVGMVDYLTKPIRHDTLVGAVDRWLNIPSRLNRPATV